MTWGCTEDGTERTRQTADRVSIDRIARAMAAAAGEDWEKLRNHPGFGRGRWRDQAREIAGL